MGLTLLLLALQLSPVDSLAESLDPEHATMAALEGLEEHTSWLFLASRGSNRARIAVDAMGTRMALAGHGPHDREWSGYLTTHIPGSVTITAGHLRPSFGAGMVLATPRFGTPETSGVSPAVRRPRLGGYAGLSTEQRIRGISVHRETERLFLGAFTAAETHAAAVELRRSQASLGALAVRTSRNRTKSEVWLQSRHGPAEIEFAASGQSIIGSLRLSRRRGEPVLRLTARRYNALGPHAAPLRLRSSQGSAEQGLTMATRWPLRRADLTLAIDHSVDGNDIQNRSRLSLSSPMSDLRIDRRIKIHTDKGGPSDTTGEWRILASKRLPGTPAVSLTGFLATDAAKTSSYLRVRIQTPGTEKWHLDASIIEFRTESGGPVAAIYEPSAEGAFPIARLSGEGRRFSARLTRTGRRTRARLACFWHATRAPDAREGPSTTTACSLSLSG